MFAKDWLMKLKGDLLTDLPSKTYHSLKNNIIIDQNYSSCVGWHLLHGSLPSAIACSSEIGIFDEERYVQSSVWYLEPLSVTYTMSSFL